MKKKISKLIKYSKGKRLLDIGAGMGTFSYIAKQKGFNVTGVELSLEECEIAKKKYNIELLNTDIYNIENDLGKFDVIHSFHVMEHLKYPSKLLDISKRLLNNNGILLIEVPYQLTKIQNFIIRNRKMSRIDYNIDHLFFFSPKTMKNYLDTNSFKIIEFNQHRDEKLKLGHFISKPLYPAKYAFHKLTSFFFIPSGSFLEFYCQ